ncbi:MAG: hypothetical protein NC388_04755 [Clostridium sp.]|nr:hypothetical protein [Clostridium sp.]
MGNLLGWGYLTNILAYSIGSLLLGIVLTIAGIALMFVLIRSWWRDSTFTPMSFLVGGILFFFLSYQAILLCGAVTIKSYCSDFEVAVDEMVSPLPGFVEVPQGMTDHILDEVIERWPLIGYYVGSYESWGHTSTDYAKAMSDESHRFMNWYILRRIAWSLAFIIIGAMLVIKTISRKYNSGRRPERVVSNRPQAPSRDHRPHVRRR